MTAENNISHVVLFDIDGTLICDKSHVDLERLKEQLEPLKKCFLFGIATARPWSEASEIYQKLHLNGPIVVENGALYLTHPNGLPVLVISDSFREAILGSLDEEFGERVVVSDDKSILRDKEVESLIFVSKSRQYSMSLYVRSNGEITKKSLLLLNKLRSHIFQNFPRLCVYLDVSQGKLLISEKFINKLLSCSIMKNTHFPTTPLSVISDAEEKPNQELTISLGAVSTASDIFKQNVHVVATRSGEKGILELIKKLTGQKFSTKFN